MRSMEFKIFNLFDIEYVLTVIIVVVILLFVENFFYHNFFQKYAKRWLPSLPVVGCSYLFFQYPMFHVFMEYSRKFMEPFYFRAYFMDHYYTEEPEELKEILTNPLTNEKGLIYSLFTWIIPDCIVLAEDSIWKRKRRYCSKAFSQRKLNRLVESFDSSANRLVEKFRTDLTLPLSEVVERNSIDSFMECIVGVNIYGDDELSALYRQVDVYHTVKLVEESVMYRYFRPWMFFDFIFLLTNRGKYIRKRVMRYRELLLKIINERKKKLDFLKDEYTDIEEKNLMDVMIEFNADDKDLMSDTIIFGTGSTETSGLILSFAVTLLGMYPNIQEKVYKEVKSVLGTSDAVEYHHLVDLKYCEMVLNETTRLFPPIPFITRRPTADLDLGTKMIRKGTDIIVGIMGAQRSERFWKDPLKFDPERWTPEEVEKRHPFTYLSFSGGPRNCIGAKYGMMMMKTALAKVVRTYKLSSNNKCVEDIKLDSNITLVVKKGLDCKFTPRS